MQDLSGTNETSLKDWSLITGRGAGLQNWKIMGPKCFALPPPPSTVAETGFEKGGGALTQHFQINGFWPEFYIKKKLDFWKNRGSPRAPPLNPPLLQDRVKRIPHPLCKGGNLLRPPPPSVWLKLQAPVLKIPQNILCPPFSMAKIMSLPPPFCSGKLHVTPRPCFVVPPHNQCLLPQRTEATKWVDCDSVGASSGKKEHLTEPSS